MNKKAREARLEAARRRVDDDQPDDVPTTSRCDCGAWRTPGQSHQPDADANPSHWCNR